MKRKGFRTIGTTGFTQARLRVPRKRFRGSRRRRPRRRNARIGGFMGIELKFYDQLLTSSALTAPTNASGGEHDPSATVLLNTVTQGDGESERDGRQIKMRKISIRGLITYAAQVNQTAGDNACAIMIALVLDKQTNGATITSENVFINPSASGTLAPQAFNNLQFIKRFKVLKRIEFNLPQPEMTYDGTNVEQSGEHIPWEMHVDLNNLEVNYSGITENVSNIVDNSLHVIAYCSSTNLVPQIFYNSRLRFVG